MDNHEEAPKKKRKKMDMAVILRLRARGWTYKQIAEKQETTEQVIKNAVYRATRQMSTNSDGRPPKPPKPELSEEKTAELVRRYEATLKQTGAMKEENLGRARAANLYVLQCIEISRMVDHENINSMYAAFEAWIKLSVEQDMPMTMTNACLALRLDKGLLQHWRKSPDPQKREFADAVKFAVQSGIEACMASGVINPVVGIWWEKAHFNMVEAQKQDAPADDPLGSKKSAAEIAEEYQGLTLPDE